MGSVLDSSSIIAAERKREPLDQFLMRAALFRPAQLLALSTIGYTELLRGLHRSHASGIAIQTLLSFQLSKRLLLYPYTAEVARLAASLEFQQSRKGITIPFADLLIGATALHHGHAILTANERHFRLIPGLKVLPF